MHVIVGTPEYLSRGAISGNLRLQNLRGIVIDEADACLGDADGHADAMARLLRRIGEARAAADVPPPQTVLAGASLTPGLVRTAIDAGWVRSPTLVSEYGWIEQGMSLEAIALPVPPGEGAASGAVAWTEQRVPAGASHQYIVSEAKDAVSVCCRLLRERFEAAAAADGEVLAPYGNEAPQPPPPRVVVFAPSADAAISLAERLQGALFGTLSGDSSAGLWGLSVLLPSAEARLDSREETDGTLSVLESSLRVMEMFACDRISVRSRTNSCWRQNPRPHAHAYAHAHLHARSQVLVTTAAATRGLDFPRVTDVINLGIVGSAADYVHRAGRVGRIGQLARGSVVSVLCAAEVSELLALGRTLHFTPHERAAPPPVDLSLSDGMSREDQVQALSDVFHLFD